MSDSPNNREQRWWHRDRLLGLPRWGWLVVAFAVTMTCGAVGAWESKHRPIMAFLVVLNGDGAIRFTAIHAGDDNSDLCGRIVCRAAWRDDGFVQRRSLHVEGEIDGMVLSRSDVMKHLPAIEKAIDDETFRFGHFVGRDRPGYTFAHATASPRIIWREVIVNVVLWLLLPVYVFVGLWWVLSVRDAWRESRRSRSLVEQ